MTVAFVTCNTQVTIFMQVVKGEAGKFQPARRRGRAVAAESKRKKRISTGTSRA
jgi:hypothetical protein